MVSPLEPSVGASGMLVTAVDVVDEPNDSARLVPMLEQSEDTAGERAQVTLADVVGRIRKPQVVSSNLTGGSNLHLKRSFRAHSLHGRLQLTPNTIVLQRRDVYADYVLPWPPAAVQQPLVPSFLGSEVVGIPIEPHPLGMRVWERHPCRVYAKLVRRDVTVFHGARRTDSLIVARGLILLRETRSVITH